MLSFITLPLSSPADLLNSIHSMTMGKSVVKAATWCQLEGALETSAAHDTTTGWFVPFPMKTQSSLHLA
eukprot:354166-Rhodomonas_salina.3